jgi:hypothetical protein
MVITKHNKQNKGKISHDHLNRCRKAFGKIQNPIHDKISEETRNTMIIPQHSKGYV